MLAHAGRFGIWNFVTADGSGAPVPFPLTPEVFDGPSGKRRALHARGSDRHDWRAVWATFGPSCYDASAFAGIRFTARGSVKIGFELSMVDGVESRHGGVCEADCYHPHRKGIVLTERFQRYEVLFHELAQAPETPAAARRALDLHRLFALAFVIDAGEKSFDFWIDDVEWFDRP